MDMFLTMDIEFCENTANIWQIIGYVVLVFKIVVPILLLIFGILDLGKAVVAAKPDEVKKAVTGLAWRAVAAIAIFFIPTIVAFLFSFIADFSNSGAKKDYDVCSKCISRPSGDSCKTNADKAWNK